MTEKGAVAKKDTSKSKTGSWRNRKPVITDECIACGKCLKFCPEGAVTIDKKKKKAVIDYDYCKGCFLCAEACPAEAIEEGEE